MVAPTELGAVLDAGVDVVVVDDADVATFDDPALARLTGPDGPALVVAAQLDAFGFGARGLLVVSTNTMSRSRLRRWATEPNTSAAIASNASSRKSIAAYAASSVCRVPR